MDGGGVVEPPLFWSRLVRLRDEWVESRETEALWHGADALSLTFGTHNDADAPCYTKLSAVQNHLFGVDFANVVIVLVADALHVLASASTCAYFEAFKAAGSPDDANLMLIIHTCAASATAYKYRIAHSFDAASPRCCSVHAGGLRYCAPRGARAPSVGCARGA